MRTSSTGSGSAVGRSKRCASSRISGSGLATSASIRRHVSSLSSRRRCPAHGVQLGQQPLRLVEDLLPGLEDDRLLEVAVTDGASEVADRGIAQLRRDHEPVEHLRHLRPGLARRRSPGRQPVVQQRQDSGQLVGDPLLGQEDALTASSSRGPGSRSSTP